MLQGTDACDRRGDCGAARRHPGAISRARDAPAQICLPGMRNGDRPGAGAGTLIKGGLPTEAMVAHVLVEQIRLALAALSPGADAAEPGDRRSSARRWRSGWAMRRRSSRRWWRGCARSCLARSSSRSMRRRCRCSIPAADAPRTDTSGRSRATTGRGAATIRPPSPTPMRRAAARSMRIKLLAGYSGIVQCDGYAAYKQLADGRRSSGPATLAFCWAHLRRRFYEIAKAGPAPIAQRSARRALLRSMRSRSDPRPQRRRNAGRAPGREQAARRCSKILARKQLARVSGKSVIADAIRYGLNHWDGLVRFLDRWPHRDRHQCRRARNPADCDDRVILHLLFKYLKTLKSVFRNRPDTGDLFA